MYACVWTRVLLSFLVMKLMNNFLHKGKGFRQSSLGYYIITTWILMVAVAIHIYHFSKVFIILSLITALLDRNTVRELV